MGLTGHDADQLPSFEAHCRALYRELVNFARRQTGGRLALAEDIVQDALIRAHDAWPEFVAQEHLDPKHAVRSWLFRIVGRTHLNHCRGERRRREVFDDVPPAAKGGPGDQTNRDKFDRHIWDVAADDPRDEQELETGDEVRLAIARLPPHQREVVELHYLEDMQPEAIARQLKLKKSTVGTRLHRARNTMEKYLRSYAKRAYNIDGDAVAAR